MSIDQFVQQEGAFLGRRLTGIYVRVLLWYLAAMALLWLVGFESIYAHPTPFYTLYAPAFDSLMVSGGLAACLAFAYLVLSQTFMHRERARMLLFGLIWLGILAGVIAIGFIESRQRGLSFAAHALSEIRVLLRHLLPAGVFLAFLLVVLRRFNGLAPEPRPKETRWMLAGMVLFAIVFACSIAMIRGGFEGIAQAYRRETYEYIGDIGKTASIRALFTRYLDIQSYLSLHARAAPPGPIALLWLFSYLVGRSAMALSLATVCFGSLAVVPLYYWAREILGRRVAVTACLLYVLVPSIVLFTATSAEILFMPFTLATLFCFDAALRRKSIGWAFAAGLCYGLLSLLKFTLLGLGGYFALAGLWMLRKPEGFRRVTQTAVVMLAGFFALQVAVRWWSGFDIIACFQTAKSYFDLDQVHLDEITPRFAGWVYRFLNPLTWFYFAGIPVSVLFLWRLRRPGNDDSRPLFLIFLGTLFLLNLLYLGRGEGERSALYIFPFLAVPAAHLLEEFRAKADSITPLAATLAFLAFQTWLTEAYFYTYW